MLSLQVNVSDELQRRLEALALGQNQSIEGVVLGILEQSTQTVEGGVALGEFIRQLDALTVNKE
ncbi:MAG: hypothetical protein ACOYL5_01495 [Phototrophicaceae bacterium]